MITVTYINFDGTAQAVCVDEGTSLMEGAVSNNIRGIEADCGGSCACATCHVYIDHDWRHALPIMKPLEQDMLSFAIGVTDRSRLSCQIYATPQLDGLIVGLPERQI